LSCLKTSRTPVARHYGKASVARRSADSEFEALGIDGVRLESDSVVDIRRFVIAPNLAMNGELFARFGLQPSL
jgi:hypothetical protein